MPNFVSVRVCSSLLLYSKISHGRPVTTTNNFISMMKIITTMMVVVTMVVAMITTDDISTASDGQSHINAQHQMVARIHCRRKALATFCLDLLRARNGSDTHEPNAHW